MQYAFETVRKFAEEVVEPKSREMDENEKMDPSIIKALFDQGVSTVLFDRRLNVPADLE